MKKLIIGAVLFALCSQTQATDINKLNHCARMAALAGLFLDAKNNGDDKIETYKYAIQYTEGQLSPMDVSVIETVIFDNETGNIPKDKLEAVLLDVCMNGE